MVHDVLSYFNVSRCRCLTRGVAYALKALTDAAGVADAALIVLNKSARNVDKVCFPYLSGEIKTNYVRHYNAVDPYSPLLDGGRKKLPECLLDSLLRRASGTTISC